MIYQEKETLLKLSNINKSYTIPILRDISFEVKNITRENLKQGQIISLIGKSGSGKSTLFRIMAGLERPNSGEVRRYQDGELIGDLVPIQEGDMGVVFQNSYIYGWRRIKDIVYNAAMRGKTFSTYEKLLTDMDIEKLLDKYPSQISGGQKQRVAIAEQILGGSNFILLDEPFSGLDTLTIDKVTKILIDLSMTDEHKTIIVVSHDLSNCLAISDTAFILAKEEGKEGATITQKIDLARMGMAWTEGIKDTPEFRDLLKLVKTLL